MDILGFSQIKSIKSAFLLTATIGGTVWAYDFIMWAFENPEAYIELIETSLRNFMDDVQNN